MYGAILGDIIGSPYEFDENNIKTKAFPLFSSESRFTDDSVMTLAVADALMDAEDKGISAVVLDDPAKQEAVRELLVKSMQTFGRRYPNAGYGKKKKKWIWQDPKPKSGTPPRRKNSAEITPNSAKKSRLKSPAT